MAEQASGKVWRRENRACARNCRVCVTARETENEQMRKSTVSSDWSVSTESFAHFVCLDESDGLFIQFSKSVIFIALSVHF